MAPVRKGDGTSLSVNGYQQVRKGDGTALFNAIPDSAIAHYPHINRSDSTIVDVLGNLDGTAQGTTNVENVGKWFQDYAEDGDGVDDHILYNEWDAVFSSLSVGGVYFTVEVSNDTGMWMSSENSGNGLFWTRTSGGFGASTGQILWYIQDSDSQLNRIYTDSARFNDGGPYRVCLTWDGTSASDMEIWVNGSQENTVVDNDDGWTSGLTFDQPVTGLARNDSGSISENVNAFMDNVIPCDDYQTESTITDDYNNQPWS